MKNIKKMHFGLICCLLAIVCSAVYCLTYFQKSTYDAPLTRTIEVSRNEIDYQSILDEFDNSKLETEGSLTTFEGYQNVDASFLSEIDNLSETDVKTTEETNVKYNFSYDAETNIVTLAAELKNELGEVLIEEIQGVAFINDDGEIDAVLNIEDESILLSEMQDAGIINNCGWFKKLIKKVVKVAVVATVAVAVVATTAAVVVATAGAAAPALVAAGVGITTSTSIGIATGVAAGALFACTIGDAAIKAGTAISEPLAEGASQIIDKVTGKIIALVISGVQYATIAVSLANIKSVTADEYRFVSIKGGLAFMSIESIKRETAVWGLRLGLNTYCVDGSNARMLAFDAGNGLTPRYHSKHEVNRYGSTKKGVYFDHYHTFHSAVTYDALGFEISTGHAFFGTPGINL